MVVPLLVLSMAATSLRKTATTDDHCDRQMSRSRASGYDSAKIFVRVIFSTVVICRNSCAEFDMRLGLYIDLRKQEKHTLAKQPEITTIPKRVRTLLKDVSSLWHTLSQCFRTIREQLQVSLFP